jgi:hypothetical protein
MMIFRGLFRSDAVTAERGKATLGGDFQVSRAALT